MAYVAWLHESDHEIPVGGKGRSLVRLHRAGFPVPPGFCITTEGYRRFAAHNSLDAIARELGGIPNLRDVKAAREAASRFQPHLEEAALPADLEREVLEAYRTLRRWRGDGVVVAVRSSAASEDGSKASFAGLYETYLNLKDEREVLEAIHQCYRSLWSHRAVHYRAVKGVDHAGEAMGVVVMEMVPSHVSGIVFTVNPVTGSRDEMIVNASWGLGEAIVSGRVTPDTFVVHKGSLQVLSKEIYDKEIQIRPHPDGTGTHTIEVPPELMRAPALSDDKLLEVARLAARIEAHYGQPQDIEWAIHDEQIYVLQSRPVTTVG